MADLCESGDTPSSPDDGVSERRLDAEYGCYVDLAMAKHVGEFKQKIEDAVRRLGFSEYAFVRLASVEDSKQLQSHTPALFDAYFNAGLDEHDLVTPHVMEKTSPIFRSEFTENVSHADFECDHTRCMRDILEVNKSFGYFDFYLAPAKAKNGKGNVLLSIGEKRLSPFELKSKVKKVFMDLKLLCEAIDHVSTRKFPGELLGKEKQEPREIVINPRPLVVLDMLANNDLNITQVAEELGINVVTANRHLQAARKAFDVKTNYAAIRQAVQSKLIQYR